ncbi:DivIVA domain-containing protein [Thermomonospora cellulosilytica]|uniref:DivIVA domain-containing protein n=1 Tax=Thermomonospora cellulosilytica TaxID=1411118 RepID=A0A7W3MZG7_9ACTN|nr:DivIVA domain-containing protein [Thermomonospora cellulosilytica]MBA9004746.1 DivIVA domain-containing protein [Thermomonospora cellulosilytica]
MPEFPVVLRGYDRRQVDELIARLEGTLGRAPLRGARVGVAELQNTVFDVVLRGYDRRQVDMVLSRYQQELSALEGGAPAGTAPPPDGLASSGREFTVVLRGYDRHQVDEMVARIEATLAGASLNGAPISAGHLGWTSFDVVLRGYDRFEVEGAMRRYRRELARLEGIELDDDEPDGGLDFVLGGKGRAPAPLLAQAAREHGLTVRWRGYDRHQVEEFLVRLWARTGHPALRGHDVQLPPVADHEFPPYFDVVLRGYDRRQVDEAIAGYRQRLGR